jgi:RNA polymerase sigma factor (sigma-70 family)
MALDDAIPPELAEGRRRFLELVGEVRPELHRYCARMTGSVADGEDVVQEALARAYYELSELEALPALRPWLFRIAHNRALDLLRGRSRRASEPIEKAPEEAATVDAEHAGAAARDEAVRLAVSRFLEIAPAQRSCVVLKDVLGHSLEEIAGLLELSVPAVKAALHRGRARLRELSAAPPRAPSARTVPRALARYAAMFNARDWDGIRATLVDDVRLDLVSRERRRGRQQVAHYFTNYDRVPGWRVVPAWLDDRAVLAAFHRPDDERPAYFVEIAFEAGRVASIRDFRYVPYIAREAGLELVAGPGER